MTDTPLDIGAMSTEFAKFAEAAAKAATDASSDKDFTQCLADTMQQMAKDKEEAQVRDLLNLHTLFFIIIFLNEKVTYFIYIN